VARLGGACHYTETPETDSNRPPSSNPPLSCALVKVPDGSAHKTITSTRKFSSSSERTLFPRSEMLNGVQAQTPAALEVQRPIVNERHFLRRTSWGDFQKRCERSSLQACASDVTRAEENEEISSKVEGFDAVLVSSKWAHC